jgi:hypothetical protein
MLPLRVLHLRSPLRLRSRWEATSVRRTVHSPTSVGATTVSRPGLFARPAASANGTGEGAHPLSGFGLESG